MQVAPSFLDAPGASHAWLPGKPDLVALDKPNVVIVFASTVGLKVPLFYPHAVDHSYLCDNQDFQALQAEYSLLSWRLCRSHAILDVVQGPCCCVPVPICPSMRLRMCICRHPDEPCWVGVANVMLHHPAAAPAASVLQTSCCLISSLKGMTCRLAARMIILAMAETLVQ